MLRRVHLCVLAILPALSGCLSHFHEPPVLDPTKWRTSDEVSEDAKNRVYVFMFDGCPLAGPLEPVGFAALPRTMLVGTD